MNLNPASLVSNSKLNFGKLVSYEVDPVLKEYRKPEMYKIQNAFFGSRDMNDLCDTFDVAVTISGPVTCPVDNEIEAKCVIDLTCKELGTDNMVERITFESNTASYGEHVYFEPLIANVRQGIVDLAKKLLNK